MGLATNIEHWDMSAAIGMATEGIRAKYNAGGGGDGFGAADMEIASKLDGGKVLAAVAKMGAEFEHLTLWAMFAYASPNWNRSTSSEKLFEYIINDWVFSCAEHGNFIQNSVYERIKTILPFIAGGTALEQLSGADIEYRNGELLYHPASQRKVMINALVDFDCANKGVESDSYKKKRVRYYQNNWARYNGHVETIRSIIAKYDTTARKIYKKCLEKQMMAI